MDKVDKNATPAVVFLEDPVGDFAILNNQRNYYVSVVETIRQSGVHKDIGNPSQEEFEHKLTTAGFIDGILKDAGPLG